MWGLDYFTQAPEKWIKQYYSDRKVRGHSKPHPLIYSFSPSLSLSLTHFTQGVELTTHYLVLVDSKFSASGTPYHYVPQEDLEIGPQQQVSPSISELTICIIYSGTFNKENLSIKEKIVIPIPICVHFNLQIKDASIKDKSLSQHVLYSEVPLHSFVLFLS